MYNYEICYINSVRGWTPLNSFKTFIIKANAGEYFLRVNNRVKKVCDDIDEIKSDLTTLKTKMGENFGSTEETNYKRIISGLDQKKADVIKKNQELFEACNKVVEYVYQNKASRADEAAQVALTIANIDVYNG